MEQGTYIKDGSFCTLYSEQPYKPATPHSLLFPFSILCSLFIVLCLCFAQNTFAEDIEVVNHPVNLSGLTGLLFTTAPYTLNTGTIEVGVAIISENSTIPDYASIDFPVSISVGLPHNAELALRSSYYQIKEGPMSNVPVERKTDNLQLMYKWNFMPPKEDSIRPAFAFILGGSMPTENTNNNIKLSSVEHWAVHSGLSGGTEITWREHIVGIYADAQAVGQDLTQKSLSDFYGVYNAGLLLPISKYQNLQMFAEYSLVDGKKQLTLVSGDYSALTYGLRLVSDRFNLTIGTQFLHKQNEGFSDTAKFIAMMSVKF
jgi:hypothetical protein